MMIFNTPQQRIEAIEEAARSNQYYDFEDVLTPRGVIGTLAHFRYDNLFALEVVHRMKELARFGY